MPALSDIHPRWRNKLRSRQRFARIAAKMSRAYSGSAGADLGNVLDPLDEAAYILLTFQTDIPRARLVWSALRSRFPCWTSVMAAPEREIADILRPSGLHVARARLLRALLAEVTRLFGAPTLEPCQFLETHAAERLLRSL